MAKIRVKINSAAARALLNSAEVKADIARRAGAVAAGAGEGFEASVQEGKSRARASVITADVEAIRKNAKNNTLLKNLDLGRS